MFVYLAHKSSLGHSLSIFCLTPVWFYKYWRLIFIFIWKSDSVFEQWSHFIECFFFFNLSQFLNQSLKFLQSMWSFLPKGIDIRITNSCTYIFTNLYSFILFPFATHVEGSASSNVVDGEIKSWIWLAIL